VISRLIRPGGPIVVARPPRRRRYRGETYTSGCRLGSGWSREWWDRSRDQTASASPAREMQETRTLPTGSTYSMRRSLPAFPAGPCRGPDAQKPCSATLLHLRRLSRPCRAARRLAARRCGGLPRGAGDAASTARAGGHRWATRGGTKGIPRGCAPEGTALKWPLFYLSTQRRDGPFQLEPLAHGRSCVINSAHSRLVAVLMIEGGVLTNLSALQ
jgi:hypothetical protein